MAIRDEATSDAKEALPKEKIVLSRARCEELLAREKTRRDRTRGKPDKPHGHFMHMFGK